MSNGPRGIPERNPVIPMSRKHGMVVTFPPDDIENNPCRHTDYQTWYLCGVCEQARFTALMKSAEEAGREAAKAHNRACWNMFFGLSPED